MSAISLPKLPAIASGPIAVEVFNGLTERPKSLSPWLFYDEAGSRLFEAITELPEYYVTRTERQILAEHADEMSPGRGGRARSFDDRAGRGDGDKNRPAAERRSPPSGKRHVPPHRCVEDGSGGSMHPAGGRAAGGDSRTDRRGLHRGHAAEQRCFSTGRRLVLYIGSSIGNFSPAEAVEVLRGVRAQLSPGDCLLLGTDMVKDTGMLLAAYDDAAGVTADSIRMYSSASIVSWMPTSILIYFATRRDGMKSTHG